jgi:hypothetical protein
MRNPLITHTIVPHIVRPPSAVRGLNRHVGTFYVLYIFIKFLTEGIIAKCILTYKSVGLPLGLSRGERRRNKTVFLVLAKSQAKPCLANPTFTVKVFV